jgi:hypothetical protein
LKTRFANLPPDKQDTVRNRLESLPPDIELVDSHDLIPIMAACAANTPSNFLTLEGVAVALILDATVIVSTQSAQIDHVGGSHALPVRLVPL